MWGRRRREIRDLKAKLAGRTALLQAAEWDADQARQVAQFQIRQRVEVEAGARRVDDRNRALTELLETARRAHHDGEYEELEARHARLLRAVVRYRSELAVQQRRIRVLQAQVDELTGLDHPLIAAGANWQERRTDKQPGFQQARSSPSGLLPRREPGVTG